MTRTATRAALLLLVGAYVAGALVWLTGAPAAAHANLLSSDPEEGSVVAQPPSEVVLTFNEPVRLGESAVRGFAPDGSDWELEARAQDNRVVVTPARDPGTGTVVVSWQVTSEDGHEVSGALSFSIGAASSGAAPPGAAPGAAPGDARPVGVTVARSAAAGLATLGLLASVGLALTGRSGRWLDLAWNVGLAAAVVLAPLHQLAGDGRGLGALTDWLAWLDGLTRGSSLLLLGAYLAVAVLRAVPGRVSATALAVPALTLLVGAVLTWPDVTDRPAAAAPNGDHDERVQADTAAAATPVTAELGASGQVELTVTRATGRAVQLDLRLLDPAGQPLAAYAPPTLTVRNDELSLGEARLTGTALGSYRATVTIPTDGSWSAQVSVRTSEFDNPVAVVPFEVS